MGVFLKALTAKEREQAFRAGSKVIVDLRPYLEAVREMDGGVAYAITLDGTTARALRWRFNRAAKTLDLKLRWAKVANDAAVVFVELAGE